MVCSVACTPGLPGAVTSAVLPLYVLKESFAGSAAIAAAVLLPSCVPLSFPWRLIRPVLQCWRRGWIVRAERTCVVLIRNDPEIFTSQFAGGGS